MRAMKKFEKYIKIINDCYRKYNTGKPFANISEEELKSNLELIDTCIDCVANVLCDNGFRDSDWEPSEHGLELEDTIGYLLRLRYALENQP